MLKKRIQRMIIAFRRAQAYRRTVSELSSLTNRDLADLGIHRSEIKTVARRSMNRRFSY